MTIKKQLYYVKNIRPSTQHDSAGFSADLVGPDIDANGQLWHKGDRQTCVKYWQWFIEHMGKKFKFRINGN